MLKLVFKTLIIKIQFLANLTTHDAEAEIPILQPPDAKNWLIGKDPDAGKDWRQEEKGMTEDACPALYNPVDDTAHGILQARYWSE